MTNKPVIFISSTSDLRSARDLVAKILYSMGYEPVWQDIEATDGGELLEVLRRRIHPCAMVLQLVGRRYGAEPPRPTAEFGRVSYTQFEAMEGERLGKKVIYHFLDERFPTDAAAPEPEELATLQAGYRQRLKEANRLRQSGIASPADLELSIRRISDELSELRRQSDRRQRHLLWLCAAAVAAIVGVAGLVFISMHRQTTANTQVTQQADETNAKLDRLAQLVAASNSPRPLAAGQTQLDPPSPEVIAAAKVLVERGSAEQKAIGMTALKQYAEADKIIQDLKSKPGNPIDEAFRLLTMEGDNWYQASEPDKAIVPYEQAMALKPDNVWARTGVAIAHKSARRGSIAGHQQRAIEIAEGTLKLTSAGTTDWAMTQIILGNASCSIPTGNRGENLKKAISAYESALTVYTKDAFPTDWAVVQNNLGVAWHDVPTGNRDENLKKAIAADQSALTVYTRGASPADWAGTQDNLGNAWLDVPTGDRGENIKRAISAFESALSVYNRGAFPAEWATTQNCLGNAWQDMPAGDRGENVQKAILAFESALTVYTQDAFPQDWAMTQNNLGNALCDIPTGDHAENVRKAILAYESALTIYTKDAFPTNWALTQNNLGVAWHSLPTGDRGANLKKEISACESALTVSTRDAFPGAWARAQFNLGHAWQDLPTGDRDENLKKAISAYEAALTAGTGDLFPAEWASTQNYLGLAWHYISSGDRGENLKKAIAAFESALTVYRRDAYPAEWARTQNNLGAAWDDTPTGDRDDTLKKAISACESALTVYTSDAFPVDWARTQSILGNAWGRIPSGDRSENLKKAISAFESALTVYSREAFPDEWATIQNNLGYARSAVRTGDRGENLKRAISAYESALTVYTKDAYPEQWLSIRTGLSWCQILTKDYPAALATSAAPGGSLNSCLPLEANHALALLFVGRTDEATAICRKHLGEKIEGKKWEDVIREDFTELEKQGLTSPDFQRVRDILANPPPVP